MSNRKLLVGDSALLTPSDVSRRLIRNMVFGDSGSALQTFDQATLDSTGAFLLSELADLAVFTPLQRRGLVTAAVASSLVGLVVDSIVFLWLAFGGLQFLAGQVVGKALMVLITIPVLIWFRNRDARLGITAA